MKRALLCLFVLAIARPVFGHALSSSALQLELRAEPGRTIVSAEWAIAARDLDASLTLDADGDGELSADELDARATDVAEYALNRLELRAGGQLCLVSGARSRRTGPNVSLRFVARCPPSARELAVRYDLFFEHDRGHEGFVRLRRAAGTHGETQAGVFTADQRERSFALTSAVSFQAASFAYLGEGIWHIWQGADHLLFLLTLLLPAVLVSDASGLRGAPKLRPALFAVLKIVTAFTVAHSLTLSLAALGLVRLSPRWIEPVIAASVIAAALCNLSRSRSRASARLAFGFGLVHGFGFADVLSELGMPRASFVPALLGFNLGVEIGQLCAVAAFFPIAFVLRNARGYQSWGLRGGSRFAIGVAALWLLERTFELELFAPLAEALAGARLSHPLTLAGAASLLTSCGWRLFSPARARALRPWTLALAGALLAAAGLLHSGWSEQRALRTLLARASEQQRAATALRAAGVRSSGAPAGCPGVNTPMLAATLAVPGGCSAGPVARLGADPLREARSRYELAGALYARAGDLTSQADVQSRIGDLELARAEPSEAEAAYRRALALRERARDQRGMAAEYRNLAVAARVRGALSDAARRLRRALELEEKLALHRAAARDSAELAALYRETGELDAAARALARAIELDASLGAQRELAEHLSKLGIVYQLDGKLAEASRCYARALALDEALGREAELANTLANAATVAQLQGDSARAAELFGRALALYEKRDSPSPAARVRALLRELGPTSATPGP